MSFSHKAAYFGVSFCPFCIISSSLPVYSFISMQPRCRTTTGALRRAAVSMVLRECLQAFSRSRASEEKKIEVGGGVVHAHRQGAEIVQGGNLDFPASTASMMPGRRLMRTPWLNSAQSKPSERISRNMARPSVWRWEFQQVENEYMVKKKAERSPIFGHTRR